MNNFESFVVELLQGRITYDGRIVEVRREFQPPLDRLPCITLDLPGDTTMFGEICVDECSRYVHRDGSVNVHVWCNTEEEREAINRRVSNCFSKALMHDYTYCTQYNEGNCKSMKRRCEASLMNSNRARRRRCPCPTEYGYQSLIIKHNLTDGTLDVEPPFYMDELDQNPPVLHSIFQCTCEYIEEYGLYTEEEREDPDSDYPRFNGVSGYDVEVQ